MKFIILLTFIVNTYANLAGNWNNCNVDADCDYTINKCCLATSGSDKVFICGPADYSHW